MVKYLILVFAFTFSACSKETPKHPPYFEVQGTSTERIAEIAKLLKPNIVPLESIVDAHFIEETKGEAGGLGPTDYCGYYALNVTPQNVALWEQALKPLADYDLPKREHFSSPAHAKSWWITKQQFSALKFYDAFDLTSRSGWLGISQTGQIYIAGCTT